ncbi:MAG: glucose-1-phosphate thymidylyltransferase RfbA [Planctomycetota bacterium]
MRAKKRPEVRGILLAGGRGTRLYPMTAVASKQLQPIYDKPMVYYPLTTLMFAGIRDILVISSPDDLPRYRALLGDGGDWGLRLSYAPQAAPRGIAEALVIGEEFIGDQASMLMLGDNLIYGRLDFLREALAGNGSGATVFAYPVGNPGDFGVVEFDADFRVLSLEEKPAAPKSNWAVPGIYIYGPGVAARAKSLKPSARGEFEITDLNRAYLAEGLLKAKPMGRGIAWLDTGTPESLLEASGFVHAVQKRQGLVIGSPEEAAYRMGFISPAGFKALIERIPSSEYQACLKRALE